MSRKGILLAGGTGSRLQPLTSVVSKQLLPLYDKPMVHYPLCTLMQAGIRDILVITTPEHRDSFIDLLGDGSDFGVKLTYKQQLKPRGIAEAFLIGESFIGDDDVALVLGDNLFHGGDLELKLRRASDSSASTIFVYRVSDPERYGVVSFTKDGIAKSIDEKPRRPKSPYAVTGLYFYDNEVIDFARKVKPSKRGELEITSISQMYLDQNRLKVEVLDSGTAWLDTGTFDSLHEAGSYIRTLQNRQATKIGCPLETARHNGWI